MKNPTAVRRERWGFRGNLILMATVSIWVGVWLTQGLCLSELVECTAGLMHLVACKF